MCMRAVSPGTYGIPQQLELYKLGKPGLALGLTRPPCGRRSFLSKRKKEPRRTENG